MAQPDVSLAAWIERRDRLERTIAKRFDEYLDGVITAPQRRELRAIIVGQSAMLHAMDQIINRIKNRPVPADATGKKKERAMDV